MTDIERLNPYLRARIEVDANGCWLWMAALNLGYGRISLPGGARRVKRYVHRITFELFNGLIPDGFQIDHLCRVRRCVNPDHLRAVTQRENILAPGALSPSKAWADRTHCQRGHRFTDADYRTAHGYRFRRCRRCHAAEERARTKLDIHIEESLT